jgi:hypothetical protein
VCYRATDELAQIPTVRVLHHDVQHAVFKETERRIHLIIRHIACVIGPIRLMAFMDLLGLLEQSSIIGLFGLKGLIGLLMIL